MKITSSPKIILDKPKKTLWKELLEIALLLTKAEDLII